MMVGWQQLSIEERRAVAEDLARDALRGFFNNYSEFEDMTLNVARRRTVNSVLLCLESRAIVAKKEVG